MLRVIDAATKPLTARQLEDLHGGTKQSAGLSKQRLREVVKLAVAYGWLDGPDRKPISITPRGADILRCLPLPKAPASAPTADAMRCADITRHKKGDTDQ